MANLPDYCWEIINLRALFETPEAGQIIPAKVCGTITRDLWLRRLTWITRRPSTSSFKCEPHVTPQIDVQMEIHGRVQYLISPEFSPIENLQTVFEFVALTGAILFPSTEFKVAFKNPLILKTYPVEVVISLHCMSGLTLEQIKQEIERLWNEA